MIQISYISSATQPLSTDQLLGLLEQCLTNNAGTGVTGMMLYGNGTFLQTLEGDENIVESLYEKIQNDPRHTNIKALHRRTIERRQYSEWTMGFKRVSDKDLQHIDGLRDFGEKDFNAAFLTQNVAVADALMDHFRKPYWDPLVRELDAQEDVIKHLKDLLAHTRGYVEIASLMLESVVDAGKTTGLSEGHLRLCELALEALGKV